MKLELEFQCPDSECGFVSESYEWHFQLEETIENFVLDEEAGESFDFNDLTDEFEYLQRRPLNLNRAEFDDLDFGLLSPTQIQDFLKFAQQLLNFTQ